MGTIMTMMMFLLVVTALLSLVVWILHLRVIDLRDELKTTRKYVTETLTVQHNLNSDVTKIIGDVVLHVKEIERGE